METVLVTGASGLLGQALVAQLAKTGKYRVAAVVSGRRKAVFPDNVQVLACDLLKEKERAALVDQVRPHRICHLAWALADGKFLDAEENINWLEASLHILRLFAQCDGQRFLFAGTSAEYGQTLSGCTEINALPQYSLYGTAKLAFERTASLYCTKAEISFTSARYFSIYGPRDIRKGRALATAIETMRAGKTFVCSNPNNIWDYIYVDDAAAATELLLDSDYCGALNIASGRPVPMREVFLTLARTMNCEDLLIFDENTKQNIVLTADVERMRQVLKYECQTDLPTGLEKMIEWWEKNQN